MENKCNCILPYVHSQTNVCTQCSCEQKMFKDKPITLSRNLDGSEYSNSDIVEVIEKSYACLVRIEYFDKHEGKYSVKLPNGCYMYTAILGNKIENKLDTTEIKNVGISEYKANEHLKAINKHLQELSKLSFEKTEEISEEINQINQINQIIRNNKLQYLFLDLADSEEKIQYFKDKHRFNKDLINAMYEAHSKRKEISEVLKKSKDGVPK